MPEQEPDVDVEVAERRRGHRAARPRRDARPTRSCSSTASAASTRARGSRSPTPTQCRASSRRTPRAPCAATAAPHVEAVEVGRGLLRGAAPDPDVDDPPRHVRRMHAAEGTPEALMYAVHDAHDRVRSADRRTGAALPATSSSCSTVRCASDSTCPTRSASSRRTTCRYLPEHLTAVVGVLAAGRTHAGVPHRRAAVQPARVVPAAARSAGRPVGRHRAVRSDRRARARHGRTARRHGDGNLPALTRPAAQGRPRPAEPVPIGGLERILRHRLGDAADLLSRSAWRATHPWFQLLDTLGRLARGPRSKGKS